MDRVSKETRSRIMRSIRRRDTKPELALKSALEARGLVPDNAHPKLPGSPDAVFTRYGLAVFVHGCFWHLCRLHYKAPANAGWRRKMDANRRRDERVRRHLRAAGWRTMVVWEHEDPSRAAARVKRRALRER